MKRIGVLFSLVLGLSVLFCGCNDAGIKNAQSGLSEDTSLANILVKGNLIVGTEGNYEPFSYINSDGRHIGFDIDVFTEVAKRLEVEVVFLTIDWNKKLQLLQNGEIDCLASAFSCTKEEAVNYTMTEPYINNAQIVVVRKSDPYRLLTDLKGKRIAARRDSTGAAAILKHNALKDKNSQPIYGALKLYPDFETPLSDLNVRYVDAVVADLHLIKNYISKGNDNLKILNEAVLSEQYVYAFRKHDALLCSTVEEILIDMEYEGLIEKMSRKWFGSDICIIGK